MTTAATLLAATSAIVALDVPIVRGSTSIESVEIRKPTPGALRGLKLLDLVQADAASLFVLLPRITNPALTEQEVRDMDLADFVECGNQVSGFLPQRGPNTGSPTE